MTFFKSLFHRNEEKLEVNYDNLGLVTPNERYIPSFRAAYKEYRSYKVEDFGYHRVDTVTDAEDFFRMASDLKRGVNLAEGTTPTSMFWLVDGVNYLGSGSVRHFLTDELRKFGGHIGYSVRPQAWGNGLGTIQLHLLLVEARKLGIRRARLTCYVNNIASQRVMEKNGGKRIGYVVNRVDGRARPTYIYEIDLTGF